MRKTGSHAANVEGEEGMGVWDDVSGEHASVEEAQAAKMEEIGYMANERKLWTEVPLKECFEKTGKKPVSVRWVIRLIG